MNVFFSLGSECNLACTYCYNKDLGYEKMSIGHISAETIHQIVQFLTIKHQGLRINFTGGEPLLFFDIILEALRKISDLANVLPSPMITTNGTLVDEDCLNKLQRVYPSVIFNVSIDGPQQVHDLLRPRACGKKGTYEATVQAVELLRDKGFIVYLNSVITTLHLALGARQYYAHMKSLGVPWLFGKGSFASSDLAISEGDFANFVLELIGIWEEDPDDFEAPWLDGILAYLINEEKDAFQEHCGSDQMIAFAGDEAYMWPCVRFVPYQEFCLGKFSERDFREKVDSPVRVQFENLFKEQICAYELHLYNGKRTVCRDAQTRRELFNKVRSLIAS